MTRRGLRSRCLPAVLPLLLAACTTGPIKPLQDAADTRSLTPEEQRLWYSAEEMDDQLQKAGYLYEDPGLQDYLDGVIDRLYPEYKGTIRVRVVDSVSLNAFALPNGSIYINTGMLARLDNEAQAATVLAHEGVHFTHKHSWQQRRTIKNTTAFSVGFGIVTGVPAIGDLISMSSIYGFSRDLEREADAEGFQRLQAAGYDVRQAPVTFEYLLAEVEALDIDEPYFFSTHPALEARIESFNELVAQHGTTQGYRGTEAYQTQVEALLPLLLADYLESGQYQSVLLILEQPAAFERYPPSAWYYLGEAYRLRGDDGDAELALNAYRKALQEAPDFAPTYRALGLYYMKNGHTQAADEHFGRYLELAPDASDRGYIEYYRAGLKTGN